MSAEHVDIEAEKLFKPVYIRLKLHKVSEKDLINWLIKKSKKKGIGLLTYVRMIVIEAYLADTKNENNG